jgi:non-ribosomal peptide synthetase component F
LTTESFKVLPNPDEVLDDTWQGAPFVRSARRLWLWPGFGLALIVSSACTGCQSFLTKHATASPSRPLLVHGSTVYTYKHVEELSNRVAHFLLTHGVQREEPVALYAHRSSALVVGIMGILKVRP